MSRSSVTSSPRRSLLTLTLLAALAATAGCGQRGPLVLPGAAQLPEPGTPPPPAGAPVVLPPPDPAAPPDPDAAPQDADPRE
jgi:predicted small lipoprotein YifL